MKHVTGELEHRAAVIRRLISDHNSEFMQAIIDGTIDPGVINMDPHIVELLRQGALLRQCLAQQKQPIMNISVEGWRQLIDGSLAQTHATGSAELRRLIGKIVRTVQHISRLDSQAATLITGLDEDSLRKLELIDPMDADALPAHQIRVLHQRQPAWWERLAAYCDERLSREQFVSLNQTTLQIAAVWG